jgi:hypothetical protein
LVGPSKAARRTATALISFQRYGVGKHDIDHADERKL